MVKQKKTGRFLEIIRVAAVLAVVTGLPGNAAGENAPPAPAAGETRRVVLLLHFQDMAALYGPFRNIRSPIDGRVFISGPVDDKALGFMDAKLEILLRDKDAHTLITAERSRDIFTALPGRNEEKLPERRLWVEVGRVLGADAVLGGFIYRFKNRTGKDYGVDDAASVAFDLHLIRVSDGRIQWSGRVDETQQPLSNDLFQLGKFISRGGKWVTSREMARDELDALVSEMP